MESDNSSGILKDDCRKEDDEKAWLTVEESTNASILINLGCFSRPLRMYFKNTPQALGGTENFTVYLGTEPQGPYILLARGTLKQSETENCATELQTFNMDYLYVEL